MNWEAEVSAFLSHLAVDEGRSLGRESGAQRDTILYKEVLKKPLDWIEGIQRAKRPSRLPVVFTREEVQAILRNLDPIFRSIRIRSHSSIECQSEATLPQILWLDEKRSAK